MLGAHRILGFSGLRKLGCLYSLLLLAAIEAVASVRPAEAAEILADRTDSDDEAIVEVAFEALSMAEGLSEPEDEDESLR